MDAAWGHISMRPSRAEVTAQLQSWRVNRRGALDGIGRHMADGLLRETLDEMIAEVRGCGGMGNGAVGACMHACACVDPAPSPPVRGAPSSLSLPSLDSL